MDNNFSDKLNQLLNNPEGMEKILSLAKTLGNPQNSENTENPALSPSANDGQNTSSAIPDILKVITNSPIGQAIFTGEKERIQLLNALKPYMNNEKKQKINTVISAMESLETLGALTKLL
ncbi:MAG: hypothetical protein IJO74_02475 [Clostridia bacterium]|nr:hypothetical protein [Clostridia bacterium]